MEFVYMGEGGSKIGLKYGGRLYDSIENPREFSLLVDAADALSGFDMYVAEERRAHLAAELGSDVVGSEGQHEESIREGVRLAHERGVDLFALARSIANGMADLEREGGKRAYPAWATRGHCAVELIDAVSIDDPRLDQADAQTAGEWEHTFEVALEVLDEQGLTPVVDALVALSFTKDREESL